MQLRWRVGESDWRVGGMKEKKFVVVVAEIQWRKSDMVVVSKSGVGREK